jgi:phosphoglycerate dehydrogenase-like enzyme
MDLLIVEPLEDEVTHWLASRHSVVCAPELARDLRGFRTALRQVRSLIVPPAIALDARMLHHAPLLRAVGQVSAGAENIDVDACARAGVEVVRSVSATAQAEAEFMIGAMINLFRRVPVVGSLGERVGRELGAATVGLVGMAPSARSLTQMLGAFGSQVIGYDPSLHASDPLFKRWGVQPASLRELLEASDAVCVQLGYFTRYEGLLGDRLLPFCKTGQVIVSIAHSAVFDAKALAEALRSGRVSAAWFDTMQPGALDPGRPLAGIETLQVTPRVASTTRQSRLRAAWSVARRIDELLRQPAPVRPRVRPSPADAATGLEAGPALP